MEKEDKKKKKKKVNADEIDMLGNPEAGANFFNATANSTDTSVGCCESKTVNIKESLNQLDKDSDCKFDLLNLYEYHSLDNSKKVKLVELLSKEPQAEQIYDFLIDGIEVDNDISEEEVVDNAYANVVTDLITDNYDMVNDYRGLLAQLDDEEINNSEDYKEVVKDVIDSTNQNIGRLSSILADIKPDTEEVYAGMQDAEKVIGEPAPVDESLNEELVKELPQEIIDEFRSLIEDSGFSVEKEGKNILDGYHFQVKYNDNIDADSIEFYDKAVLRLSTQELVDAIHAFEEKYGATEDRHSDYPITYNFGFDYYGNITGGIDIRPKVKDIKENLNEDIEEDYSQWYDNTVDEIIRFMYNNFPEYGYIDEAEWEDDKYVIYFDREFGIDQKRALKDTFDNIEFGHSRNEYAPEITHPLIIIYKNKQIDEGLFKRKKPMTPEEVAIRQEQIATEVKLYQLFAEVINFAKEKIFENEFSQGSYKALMAEIKRLYNKLNHEPEYLTMDKIQEYDDRIKEYYKFLNGGEKNESLKNKKLKESLDYNVKSVIDDWVQYDYESNHPYNSFDEFTKDIFDYGFDLSYAEIIEAWDYYWRELEKLKDGDLDESLKESYPQYKFYSNKSGWLRVSDNVKIINYLDKYIVTYKGHTEEEFKTPLGAIDFAETLAKEKGEKLLDESLNEAEGEEEVIEDEEIIEDDEDNFQLTYDITEFEPWSGAIQTFENIKAEDKLDDFYDLVEEKFPDGVSEEVINDYLWYNSNEIYRKLGMREYID